MMKRQKWKIVYVKLKQNSIEVKPLSVEELRQRALRNVNKREREVKFNAQSDVQAAEKRRQAGRKK